MNAQTVLGLVDNALDVAAGLALGFVKSGEIRETVRGGIGVLRALLREAIERDVVLRGTADGVPGTVTDER